MFDSQVLAFLGIVTLIIITPGAGTLLVIRNVLTRGQKAGLLTTLGICAGLFVHATLSAVGLSVIVLRSAVAFDTVKLAGAGSIIFLGSRALWQALRSQTPEALRMQGRTVALQPTGGGSSFVEGLLTNVLSPEVAVFSLAFLPQFIHPSDPVLGKSLLLAGMHFVLGLLWLSLVTLLLGRMQVLLARPAIRRGLATVSGAMLIAFGVRLTMAHR